MKRAYRIEGMTCGGCKASVTKYLKAVSGVREVEVSLEHGEAVLELEEEVPLSAFAKALPEKYTISLKNGNVFSQIQNTAEKVSKWRQLKPLFLIFGYLVLGVVLVHIKEWNTAEAMLDFMGIFYIVFSFFKFLDLRGFKNSFGMYDPIAKAIPSYGWLYPFLELGLGVLFLMRIQLPFALIATLLLLGATTIGVIKVLLGKKEIQCACLGTALKLPMTEATFIENAIMILMAVFMLTQYY